MHEFSAIRDPRGVQPPRPAGPAAQQGPSPLTEGTRFLRHETPPPHRAGSYNAFLSLVPPGSRSRQTSSRRKGGIRRGKRLTECTCPLLPKMETVLCSESSTPSAEAGFVSVGFRPVWRVGCLAAQRSLSRQACGLEGFQIGEKPAGQKESNAWKDEHQTSAGVAGLRRLDGAPQRLASSVKAFHLPLSSDFKRRCLVWPRGGPRVLGPHVVRGGGQGCASFLLGCRV